MLVVFGDESHDQACQRVFAVAGLLGEQKQWDKLEPVWKTRIEGRCFHAAECECDQGDYRNTPHVENLKLYRDLTKILADSGLIGFGAAINLTDYRSVFPLLLEDQPFYLCFADVVKYCAEVGCLSIPPATVKFIFDRNREREYNAKFLYDHMASTPDWRLHAYLDKGLSFASRQSYVGIQAADLLARETMKHLDNQCGPVQRFPRASIRTLAKTNRFRFQYYVRASLEALRREAEELGKLPGAKMSDYRTWLVKNGRTDGMSARLNYLTVIDTLEREAESERRVTTGEVNSPNRLATRNPPSQFTKLGPWQSSGQQPWQPASSFLSQPSYKRKRVAIQVPAGCVVTLRVAETRLTAAWLTFAGVLLRKDDVWATRQLHCSGFDIATLAVTTLGAERAHTLCSSWRWPHVRRWRRSLRLGDAPERRGPSDCASLHGGFFRLSLSVTRNNSLCRATNIVGGISFHHAHSSLV